MIAEDPVPGSVLLGITAHRHRPSTPSSGGVSSVMGVSRRSEEVVRLTRCLRALLSKKPRTGRRVRGKTLGELIDAIPATDQAPELPTSSDRRPALVAVAVPPGSHATGRRSENP